jgi:serine/threonine-protein kinase
VHDFGIDPPTWRRLNQLLDEALDLSPEARPAWLTALPPEDEPLTPRLRALLSYEEASDEGEVRLGTLPKFEGDVLAGDEGEAGQAGELVGPYRLTELLGEGGMGAVWLAERTDGMLQRPVALKFPRGVYSRPELVGRIARERDILASLNHPHIAKIYDAGITARGQPYLALELVEGKRLDEYVEANAPDLTNRLRLFLQVAGAVAYAHSRLVVHRDVKPSNILVTADGSVRLLDFGVAKILEDGRAPETEITRLSGPALTLAYTSPEQLSGGAIGVGADIYSLGVVLFELLTGSRPYQPENDSRSALEKAILHEAPPRPSAVAEDEGARSRLRGDLDTILLKALKKDPSERYPTVDAFMADIERYLEGRPVLARPDSAAYRFRKFVGRNRLMVAAASTVLLAILGGAGLTLWQARVAIAEKARAEDVKEFIVSVFQDANPYIGGDKAFSAADLLRNAEDRILAGFDEGTETRIELLTIVGASLHELQEYDSASRVLERAVSEAAESLGPTHPRTLHARVARINNYRFLGKTEEMKRELDSVLPLLERESSDMADRIDAIENSAHLAIDEGRYEAAERSADRAFALAMTAYGEKHVITAGMSRLQAVTYRFNKNERAAEAAENAYRINLEYHGGNLRHPSVIDVRASYALSLIDRGRLAEGIGQLAATVEDARSLFGDESAIVGFFAGHLAKAQTEFGDIPSALGNAQTHLQILTGLAEPDSFTYASTMSNHGTVLVAARRAEEAVAQLDEAIDKLGSILAPSHALLANARLNRARSLAYSGDTAAADAELDAIEGFFENEDPPRHRWLNAKGTVARLAGDYRGALSRQRAAIAAIPQEPSSGRLQIPPLVEIGLTSLDLGESIEAEQAFARALSLAGKELAQSSPLRADALVGLGRLFLARGESARALAHLEEAEAYWREVSPESRWAGEAAFWLGRCYEELERTDDARKAIARGARILSRSSLPRDARLLAGR